ncbi:MAG: helix-turn-helix domain-containing protein [Candidatus Lokiarchaeota archaeon]|nr:helix-turn-helix domain-containing protein [Candidatus Lokiarchaeota archaeon]
MRFREKLVSRIKELRNEKDMQQKDLADLLGVSRQTIYYLEKGTYTPKLTLSLNIARIFNKPTEDIFFLEPVIRDVIGGITIDQLDNLSDETGIHKGRIEDLRKITNKELEENYTKNELINLSNALGLKFEDLFKD